MEKERNYYKNTYHHLYNRGANQASIFYERESYLYFLRRMKIYSRKYRIKILSYCLSLDIRLNLPGLVALPSEVFIRWIKNGIITKTPTITYTTGALIKLRFFMKEKVIFTF
ncbi:MAG: hypothetical protein IPJ03_00780 [Ignavibacteriales bacterium]|nr:hypothetical protein [Ignavibacteriales bacterium]